jgi:hypothetical protein
MKNGIRKFKIYSRVQKNHLRTQQNFQHEERPRPVHSGDMWVHGAPCSALWITSLCGSHHVLMAGSPSPACSTLPTTTAVRWH